MNKINVWRIIVGHFESLRDFGDPRVSLADVLFFFGVPLVVSAAGLLLGWRLYIDALNALLAAFAIFAGLLLNLLILIYTFSADSTHPSALARIRGLFVRELHNNISFSILLSIAIVVVALVAVAELKMQSAGTPESTGPVLTFLLVYLTSNFVLTLLMILKRIHTMLNRELETPAVRKISSM